MRCNPDKHCEETGKRAFHGYVRVGTHDEFECYWGEIGLTSASALVSLLIVREIQLKRLGTRSAQIGPEPRVSKVSAYVPMPQALLFKEHAAGLGRSVSECVAELVEREVDERWLLAALRQRPQEHTS